MPHVACAYPSPKGVMYKTVGYASIYPHPVKLIRDDVIFIGITSPHQKIKVCLSGLANQRM